jgi:hypothetical protein
MEEVLGASQASLGLLGRLSLEKLGIIVKLPLTCSTCGKVGHECYMQWCSACNKGICPSCMPKDQDGVERCKDCIEKGKPSFPGIHEIGRILAIEKEKRILRIIMGTKDE